MRDEKLACLKHNIFCCCATWLCHLPKVGFKCLCCFSLALPSSLQTGRVIIYGRTFEVLRMEEFFKLIVRLLCVLIYVIHDESEMAWKLAKLRWHRFSAISVTNLTSWRWIC